MTKWTHYLKGQQLSSIQALISMPTVDEPALSALISAFSAVVEDARRSVLDDRINVFDLHRVASFIQGRPFKKPLLTKLQEGTYTRYKGVWQQLLCFVYRLTVLRQAPSLHYLLTFQQQEAIN
ncbi:hypothetical protein K469DRAFT_320443 [Zopfia rhizophila CBS 207.26]|uniref:Uncharacterized protein n=1 Tax=Zopfia rhizophila CBS 207.26 TaxID=1314779 RepID=A0A6A6DJ56_9PEZI|nr:hypothetical protein K469DRAFT_320443 [Zopfia rhizophila CBS 207.26]